MELGEKEESGLQPLTLWPVIIQIGPDQLVTQSARRRTYIAQVLYAGGGRSNYRVFP